MIDAAADLVKKLGRILPCVKNRSMLYGPRQEEQPSTANDDEGIVFVGQVWRGETLTHQ